MNDWTAFHVFLPYSMQSDYLGRVVRPLLTDLPAVRSFFFLRYWQGGPHVRLRFAGEGTTWRARVEDALRAGVPGFTGTQIAEYEYESSAQARLAALEGEQPIGLRGLGTVTAEAYVPEPAKYGGPAGVAIAESVFVATSGALLRLLPGRPASGPPVGEAARIMLESLAGIGLDAARMRGFMRRYADDWQRYQPPDARDRWAALYAKVRTPFARMLEAILPGDHRSEFASIYAGARREAELLDPRGPAKPVTELQVAGVPFLSCVANYLHTTNNRLGVHPAQEALIARLAAQALTDFGTSPVPGRSEGGR
ncbi:lantibiotic dehydratase C-terminal domain-containing protein [Sphaerisporangium fuscum]|uniref:lantibiotic dehydratase C-terminal domain-containing protein n=1 Tax=Sphaerisporangium fuscum TaxID=2835868 RepID=UPI001BDC109C|nr:lantibiotic dehydratase C-terminal domain-containing protein [Sphaerisporangium fuscum]